LVIKPQVIFLDYRRYRPPWQETTRWDPTSLDEEIGKQSWPT
jgi:hypothetical protein